MTKEPKKERKQTFLILFFGKARQDQDKNKNMTYLNIVQKTLSGSLSTRQLTVVITTTTTGVQIVGRGFQMVKSEFKRTHALVFFPC